MKYVYGIAVNDFSLPTDVYQGLERICGCHIITQETFLCPDEF